MTQYRLTANLDDQVEDIDEVKQQLDEAGVLYTITPID